MVAGIVPLLELAGPFRSSSLTISPCVCWGYSTFSPLSPSLYIFNFHTVQHTQLLGWVSWLCRHEVLVC